MREWAVRGQKLNLGLRCLVMGIVNTTPDSFSDGGKFETVDLAVAHAEQLLAEGADILDIGGESSRPGALPVNAQEELKRVLPVVERIARHSKAIISVDTVKASVARACLDAGAHIINDISSASDPNMVGVVEKFGAGFVIMHMQGTPRTMQANPNYRDVTNDVRAYLSERVQNLCEAGLVRNQIVLDPGIGFGKTTVHNLQLIKNLRSLSPDDNLPILLGVSRKRFIGEITAKETSERLAGSLAIAAFALVSNSTQILRVHDVAPTVDLVRMIHAVASVE